MDAERGEEINIDRQIMKTAIDRNSEEEFNCPSEGRGGGRRR